MSQPLGDDDYRSLATFRRELRLFLRFSEGAAAEAGLTPHQYQALLAIRAAPGNAMLVGEVAEELLVRANSASELVGRLEALGLAERHATDGDRRQVRVGLTPAALSALDRLAAMHRIELERLQPILGAVLSRS